MNRKSALSAQTSATDMAIDWARSIAEEMYEFVDGDASALMDLAINAVEGSDDFDEDLEFDEAVIESAIEAMFSRIHEADEG